MELYNILTNTSCKLEDLPYNRTSHTSVDGIICGGQDTAARTSCIDISSGSWSSDKYQNIRPRYQHKSWNINPGESFLLLGGGENTQNRRTTDIVYINGTVVPGFDLQYDVS